MNKLKIGSWIFASFSITVLALVGACAGGDRKSDTYAQEAWTYFKKMCDEKSGEKIYRMFSGVKSVLIAKPLPPATEKDLFNQYWYGDPYSDATPWDKRGVHVATLLTLDSRHPTGIRKGLEYVELRKEGSGPNQYQRISKPLSNSSQASVVEIAKPSSRFAVAWEDISTAEDRKYWVAGSRLRVIDLTDNSIVAERVGYFIEAGFGSTAGQRRPWLSSRGPNTTCPPLSGGDYSDNWFVTKVFEQAVEK